MSFYDLQTKIAGVWDQDIRLVDEPRREWRPRAEDVSKGVLFGEEKVEGQEIDIKMTWIAKIWGNFDEHNPRLLNLLVTLS